MQALFSIWGWFLYAVVIVLAVPWYLAILIIPIRNKLNWWWRYNCASATVFSWLTGIRYEIRGLDRLKQLQPCIMVANHSSVFDMPILGYSIRMPYYLLGKKELRRMPLLGWVFSKIMIFVDRESSESRKKSMEDLKQLIVTNKVSVFIFPEGTRKKEGEQLISFKTGAFRLAKELNIPIVPIAFINASKVSPMDDWKLYKGLLGCFVLEPIYPENNSFEHMRDLSFRQIENALDQWEGKI